jgi:hypothetical protein
LDPVTERLGECPPVGPGVLVQSVLDRQDREAIGERSIEVDHGSRIESPTLSRQLVVAVAEDLARCWIERDPDAFPVPGTLGRLEHRRDRFLRRPEIGREPSFITDPGGEAPLVQDGLELMEHLRADSKSLGERRRTGRNDHELLQIEAVLRVRASVDHVHHRHGKRSGLGPTQPSIQRDPCVCSCRLGRGERQPGSQCPRRLLFRVPSSSISSSSSPR